MSCKKRPFSNITLDVDILPLTNTDWALVDN